MFKTKTLQSKLTFFLPQNYKWSTMVRSQCPVRSYPVHGQLYPGSLLRPHHGKQKSDFHYHQLLYHMQYHLQWK